MVLLNENKLLHLFAERFHKKSIFLGNCSIVYRRPFSTDPASHEGINQFGIQLITVLGSSQETNQCSDDDDEKSADQSDPPHRNPQEIERRVLPKIVEK